MRRLRYLPLLALCLLSRSHADVRNCACDVNIPATLEARECSLCKAVEGQPPAPAYLFLRDSNPTKPHRWLALPRFHGSHPQQLLEMTAEQRTGYWTAAIAKAREVWPNDPWGIALNSTAHRSQCHIHLHIGRLIPDLPDRDVTVVDAASEIPVPKEGDGVWIHMTGGRIHVHSGVPDGELNLER